MTVFDSGALRRQLCGGRALVSLNLQDDLFSIYNVLCRVPRGIGVETVYSFRLEPLAYPPRISILLKNSLSEETKASLCISPSGQLMPLSTSPTPL